MTATEIIESGLTAIRKALGSYLVTDDNPCAAQAYYDAGEAKPWRIADDHASESFATLDEAIDEAESWASCMEEEEELFVCECCGEDLDDDGECQSCMEDGE